jgi:peptidoglycan/xylan/chitin deacetylase (PgdA/CDA1 family)
MLRRHRILSLLLFVVVLQFFDSKFAPAAAGPHGPTDRLLNPEVEVRQGGIIRGPTRTKKIALLFAGHEFAEGGAPILQQLKKHDCKASFFVTGDFLTNTNFASLINRILQDGHYLGPHSDKHLLYCSWQQPAKTLISREQFRADLLGNIEKLERFGLARTNILYFLPAFEHYNEDIVDWTRELRLQLINFTPGTRSNADYTGESDPNFVNSSAIFDNILTHDQSDPKGLNGFLLLFHLGAGPGRTDKFHSRFGELLDQLAVKGYQFVRVDELLQDSSK